METKVCNRCLKELPIEEFNWRWKAMGTRQRTCKSCQHKQQADWYERNSETHKVKVYQNKLGKIAEGRAYILNYFSTHPCVDCGESDPSVLDFDHVRGQKRTEVTKLLRDGYSIEVIRQEIEKCEVRCANCHRRKTNRESQSWRFRG